MLRFDHVVVKVNQLDAAMAHYETLGFNVLPGGNHPNWGSHNAVIPLADDTYLELAAFKQPALITNRLEAFTQLQQTGHSRLSCRWLSLQGTPEGLVDFALTPTDTGTAIERLNQCGLDYEGPLPGRRLRPDGTAVAWEMGLPNEPDLPFFCGDVTPRELRVPAGSARTHPNGVSGLAEIRILVSDLTHSTHRYAILFDRQPEIIEGSAAHFEAGQTRLVLMEPTTQLMQNHLTAHGPGPWSIQLYGPHKQTLNPEQTHNARIEIIRG